MKSTRTIRQRKPSPGSRIVASLREAVDHVVMQNAPDSHFHQHEYIQSAERCRDHDEEIASHAHLGMVMDEGQPTLHGAVPPG